MFRNPLLVCALLLTASVATWGLLDTQGLADNAGRLVKIMFQSRGWFIMLTASILLLSCLGLAISPYGKIKLGHEDDEPEFSTKSWLTMMFAAGMGVGLLFYGSAEPITHSLFAMGYMGKEQAASTALFVTYFHWGLHAWAIYGFTALVLAYFGFRRKTPQLVSAPIYSVFGRKGWTKPVGWLTDLLSIYAIAIGLAGSVAMGIFQLQEGIAYLFHFDQVSFGLTVGVFIVFCVSYLLILTVDLSKGLATISNAAVLLAICLMLWVLLAGPTSFLMDGITEGLGIYISRVIPRGFMTYTFYDEAVHNWFKGWTLNYMVWWLAWAPFVGVFIARISRGRTIREFLLSVLLAPTFFAIMWFGVFGGMGFFDVTTGKLDPHIVQTNISQTSFQLLATLPLSFLSVTVSIIATFLFLVTGISSASFVLAMFSSDGDQNPSVRIKLVWGVILGGLGFVMTMSNNMEAVRQIIALSASPFVFIILLLLVCLFKVLKTERI